MGAEIILNDNVPAIKIYVAAGGIGWAIGMEELIVFDEHIGRAPGPQAAASSPFARIVITPRTMNVIVFDMPVFHSRHLDTRTTGF